MNASPDVIFWRFLHHSLQISHFTNALTLLVSVERDGIGRKVPTTETDAYISGCWGELCASAV